MKTVKEVSRLTGVSVRTLHHYDAIGLLKPSRITASGYRMYDYEALRRLHTILLFRELEFPLSEIKSIIDSPDFDQNKALEQQIQMLDLKRKHLSDLISYARQIQIKGVKTMDFSAFDKTELDSYAAQAKATWGQTEAYKEFEEKTKGQAKEQMLITGNALMNIFAEMGKIRHLSPDDDIAQAKVADLQNFITNHYYTCTKEILSGLGKMYVGGGSMTDNINSAGGEGTAEFAAKAIEIYCKK